MNKGKHANKRRSILRKLKYVPISNPQFRFLIIDLSKIKSSKIEYKNANKMLIAKLLLITKVTKKTNIYPTALKKYEMPAINNLSNC